MVCNCEVKAGGAHSGKKEDADRRIVVKSLDHFSSILKAGVTVHVQITDIIQIKDLCKLIIQGTERRRRHVHCEPVAQNSEIFVE